MTEETGRDRAKKENKRQQSRKDKKTERKRAKISGRSEAGKARRARAAEAVQSEYMRAAAAEAESSYASFENADIPKSQKRRSPAAKETIALLLLLRTVTALR